MNTFAIDWSLDRERFKKQMEDFVAYCAQTNLVMPIPVDATLGTVAAINSLINCSGCDSKCCRDAECAEKVIALTPAEISILCGKYGGDKFSGNGINMPCPFLTNDATCTDRVDHRCRIYNDRPLVCVMYPIQPGGGINGEQTMSLSSFCPEARRIVVNLYVSMWQIMRVAERAGVKEGE